MEAPKWECFSRENVLLCRGLLERGPGSMCAGRANLGGMGTGGDLPRAKTARGPTRAQWADAGHVTLEAKPEAVQEVMGRQSPAQPKRVLSWSELSDKNGAAAVGNSVAPSQKHKPRIPIWSSNPLPGYIMQRIERGNSKR